MDDFADQNEPLASEPIAVEPAGRRIPFRKSVGTYIVLIFLLFLFPAFNIGVSLIAGNDLDFGGLDPVLFFFIPTIVMLWAIVLVVLLALWREKSSLPSIGMGIPTFTHFGIGIAFFILSGLVLTILQLILQAIGIPFSDSTDQILKIAIDHIWWWLVISITAGVCEEIIYRGYLMSRIKGLTGWGWTVPTLCSVVAFSSGHLYQGVGGVIVIGAYGAMFCALYVMTGSIWPGIFAHFLQDYSAILFFKLSKYYGF